MSKYVHLKGRDAVLERKPELTALGRQMGVRDAGAQMEVLLDGPSAIVKIPHLIMPVDTTDGGFAVLLREYTVGGVASGVLIPIDHSGELTVLARQEQRLGAGLGVLEYLLQRDALVVLLSLPGVDLATQPPEGVSLARYATQTRRLRRSVPLQSTLDDTLAQFGARTRRNFRHYARLASTDLKAIFHTDCQMSREEFLNLNGNSTHSLPRQAARKLYRSSTGPHRFSVAMTVDGSRYISALGGRRFEDQAIVDWQFNDRDLKQYSLATAIRYFYMQHEIERGTKLLSFEGGTTHSMQNGFVEEPVSDVLAARPPFPPRLLRRAIASAFPGGSNFLSHTLLKGKDSWQ